MQRERRLCEMSWSILRVAIGIFGRSEFSRWHSAQSPTISSSRCVWSTMDNAVTGDGEVLGTPSAAVGGRFVLDIVSGVEVIGRSVEKVVGEARKTRQRSL